MTFLRSTVSGIVIVAAAAGWQQATAPQQPPTFRGGAETVVVYPTVHDRDGRLVPDLTRDDFTVFDNGQPSAITVFSNDVQPITVAVLLDMSGSMLSRFLKAREGTLRFIDALLPDDRMRLGSFGDEVALSPILTGDKVVLSRIAHEEFWPGGGTPMWNAVFAAEQSLASETGRRVVLIVTDGYDTGSLAGRKGNIADVRRAALRDGFMLYAIGMEGVMPLGADLVSLVEDTGGGHFHVKLDDDLAATFGRVSEELRRQYVIGFKPGVLDGKEHKLEVKSQKGLIVRARKSFVADR